MYPHKPQFCTISEMISEKKKKQNYLLPRVFQYPPTNPSLGPSLVLDLLFFGGQEESLQIVPRRGPLDS